MSKLTVHFSLELQMNTSSGINIFLKFNRSNIFDYNQNHFSVVLLFLLSCSHQPHNDIYITAGPGCNVCFLSFAPKICHWLITQG